jgi:hypothetical protein
MRIFMFLMALVLVASGCKKQIEEKKEDLLLNLIVDGQWVVAKYMQGTVNMTGDFSPYSFQFKKNYTVEAIIDDAVVKTGTWNGSIATRTIISNFPNANPILQMLNGTWLVTDSGLDYVESKQTIDGKACFLRLVKI